MTNKLVGTIAGLATTLLWTANALAMQAGTGGNRNGVHGGGGGGDGTASSPEIDGPGGVMAVALLVSLGVMIYRKAVK